MKKPINDYKSIIFDCDGVILNSNKIKTDAFYQTTKYLGDDIAKNFIEYHKKNAGVSRYKKFKYLINEIMKQKFDENLYNYFLNSYSNLLKKDLMICEIVEGLKEFRKFTKHANWLVVSGSDQKELNDLFRIRKLSHFFNGGIYGSPQDKEQILKNQIIQNNIKKPALFIGDSIYDYSAAISMKLDFVFMSQWTELEEYEKWCYKNDISVIKNLKDKLLQLRY